jgi:tetratricopeptide (TPR) repeat protein
VAATYNPGMDVAALFQRAVALHQQGQLGAAEQVYLQVVQRDPRHAEAIHHLGVLAFRAGAFADAVRLIGDSLALQRRNAAAHSNLGLALQQLGRLEEALASFERALALQADFPEALYNRANVQRELGRPEAALAGYDDALRRRPAYVEAHVNRGRTLRDLGRMDEAIAAYDAALRLQPGFATAELNQGIVRLALGDFARGLAQFEARWREPQLAAAARRLPMPVWDGSAPLAGATLLLHAEQGLGDTLQFCRYVPLLAARGARVVLEVQAPLAGLLRRMPGVAAVVTRGEELPRADFHCPLVSLPLRCGTTLATIPAGDAYLQADVQRVARWAERLGARRAGLRIGLVWSGNPAHRNDRTRSLPLAMLLHPLLEADAELVSLQKEVPSEDDVAVAAAHAERLRSFGAELADFDDTAALTACVDLVIAVDTAVAHLAGALGKPLWLLLPFAADWRWLMTRSDSPWYPTARLFRQPRPGDWASVLEELRLALPAATRDAGAATGA